jgi:hypothetical protein
MDALRRAFISATRQISSMVQPCRQRSRSWRTLLALRIRHYDEYAECNSKNGAGPTCGVLLRERRKSRIALLPVRSTSCKAGLAGGRDAEQGLECSMPGSPAVEAKDELIEVGLEVLGAQPVIDAQGPAAARLRGSRLSRLERSGAPRAVQYERPFYRRHGDHG